MDFQTLLGIYWGKIVASFLIGILLAGGVFLIFGDSDIATLMGSIAFIGAVAVGVFFAWRDLRKGDR